MLPDITKKLQDKVSRTIEEQKLIEPNQHIVTGLSGGPDSMCLFHVLLSMRERWNLKLYPVHINHKFRPGDAERDQAFVEAFCKKHGLTCRTFITDCNALAQETGMTGEEAGRKARYDAFHQVAAEIAREEDKEDVKIAVAQNANDQAETVLFRLLRGTGTDGLAGMAYKRRERGIQVIRPLLDVYREEIEEYCDYNKLDPVVDHTNKQALYTRNKIRLELIPFLEKGYNENIQKSLVRLAGIAAEDKAYLWEQTETAYRSMVLEEQTADTAEAKQSESTGSERDKTGSGQIVMDRAALAALPNAIRHRVIFKAFGMIGLDKDISEERIAAADSIIGKKQAPKTIEFPHGYKLTVAAGKVKFL